MDACDLDHRPDGAPGNDSCTFFRGFEEDMLSPEQPMYLVCNRPRCEGDMHQVFLSLFNRLRDCDGHFGRLPFSDAHPSLAIPNDNQRTKVEPLSTLYDFRHAVDKDNFVLQA
jgi:hypothetical protein